jgi:hypothetical protein
MLTDSRTLREEVTPRFVTIYSNTNPLYFPIVDDLNIIDTLDRETTIWPHGTPIITMEVSDNAELWHPIGVP